MNPIRFLTVKEAAAFLRVSISSIYHWRLQGRLKGLKHGRNVLFDIEELEKFDESEGFRRDAFSTGEAIDISSGRRYERCSLICKYRQELEHPSQSEED